LRPRRAKSAFESAFGGILGRMAIRFRIRRKTWPPHMVCSAVVKAVEPSVPASTCAGGVHDGVRDGEHGGGGAALAGRSRGGARALHGDQARFCAHGTGLSRSDLPCIGGGSCCAQTRLLHPPILLVHARQWWMPCAHTNPCAEEPKHQSWFTTCTLRSARHKSIC
jgi:hypothetical protein